MTKHYKYPRWRTHWDGIVAYFFPVKSERDFIRLMSPWWFFWHGFKHQYHIPPYRPDFVNPKLKLIIEIEGWGKSHSGDIVKDWEYSEGQKRRHQWLTSRGWSILYVKYSDYNPDGWKSNPPKTRALVKAWVRKKEWSARMPWNWRRR